MFNLFDILRQAQGGAAMDNLARQYGLSLEQTHRAVEALLPAFTLGMQRMARNPAGLSELFANLGAGRYAQFYDSPSQAFSPHGQQQAADAMAQIFGSPEVARQVAEHAASMTGVGIEVMRQMMPFVSGMMMGGLSRAGSGEAPGEAFSQMADFMRGAVEPNPGTAGQGGPGARSWEDLVGSLMRGGMPERGPAGTPGQGPGPGEGAPETPFEMWGRLVESGREAQEQHLTAVRNILDTFWGAPAAVSEAVEEDPDDGGPSQAGTASRRPPR